MSAGSLESLAGATPEATGGGGPSRHREGAGIRVPHCGESYLNAETLHELERIKLHRRNMALPRSTPDQARSDSSSH